MFQLNLSNCSLNSLDLTINNNSVELLPIKNDSNLVYFPNLRSLHLSNNPWHCDCSLYQSLEKLMHYDKEYFESESLARLFFITHLLT